MVSWHNAPPKNVPVDLRRDNTSEAETDTWPVESQPPTNAICGAKAWYTGLKSSTVTFS